MRGLTIVALATVVGVVASFLSQVITARYLAPVDFGLFSAFLVIVNVAAIGSASLQNTVTVHTAEALSLGSEHARRRWPAEAVLLGLCGGAVVAALAPALSAALDTNASIVVAAAVSIPLSFVFADTLGLLQGSGDVSRAVWWTTASQVARVLLLLVAIAVGAGLVGVVGSVIGAIALCLAGSVWAARRIRRPASGAFSRAGATIILMTITFAWLTSSDNFYLRIGAPEHIVGMYAAATVLIRAGFLIPSTLSLYLLPRFVRNRSNATLARAGVIATLVISLATSGAMIILCALFGPWIIHLLYGPAYADASALLVPAALAYSPWIAAQGLLIKMTSTASRAGAALLVVAALGQAAAFVAFLPDIVAMLWSFGAIGTVVLTGFIIIEIAHDRRLSRRPRAST